MAITDPAGDRQYALDFARGALEQYFEVGPERLGLRESATGLTGADLLSTAVEMLLDQLDPGGPKPWLSTGRADLRQVVGGQGTTVTMTDGDGGDGFHPRWRW